MRRRNFITLLGGAAAAWPLAARAQQRPQVVIGYLSFAPISLSPHFLAAFRKGLGAEGFVDGQNVTLEFRSADGDAERLPELAADLVRREVAAIAAPTPPAALAAKRATQTIPVVFTSGADPVQIGLVSSLNRPGGNVTGLYFLLPELVAKRLALLHELLPQTRRVAVLVNPVNRSDAQPTVQRATAAARALGLEIQVFNGKHRRRDRRGLVGHHELATRRVIHRARPVIQRRSGHAIRDRGGAPFTSHIRLR
jgi:putative ABC transport system substrate-binding protein